MLADCQGSRLVGEVIALHQKGSARQGIRACVLFRAAHGDLQWVGTGRADAELAELSGCYPYAS